MRDLSSLDGNDWLGVTFGVLLLAYLIWGMRRELQGAPMAFFARRGAQIAIWLAVFVALVLLVQAISGRPPQQDPPRRPPPAGTIGI